ncbi:MAG: NIPSNAP family protein [Vulcanimicrobiaceae bacterium]
MPLATGVLGGRRPHVGNKLDHGFHARMILELRQYTLHAGMRETLIDLFEREFLESQDAVGIRVLGQFRDLDDPNPFVWLRDFRNMAARAHALAAFYGGPVWKAHRDAANSTMVDSDNVLLLRPARPKSGFSLDNGDPASPATGNASESLVFATIYSLEAAGEDDFTDFFECDLQPVLADAGSKASAYYTTEHSANTFPALPVRENENVFVWFTSFADIEGYERHLATLDRSTHWSKISAALARRLKRSPEVLKLSPTARSRLRG